MPMTPEKKQRVAAAAGFLSGVLACLDALREVRVYWPLDVVWQAMRRPQRLEFCGGLALIAVVFITKVVRHRR
jgi:hypothetical protein